MSGSVNPSSDAYDRLGNNQRITMLVLLGTILSAVAGMVLGSEIFQSAYSATSSPNLNILGTDNAQHAKSANAENLGDVAKGDFLDYNIVIKDNGGTATNCTLDYVTNYRESSTLSSETTFTFTPDPCTLASSAYPHSDNVNVSIDTTNLLAGLYQGELQATAQSPSGTITALYFFKFTVISSNTPPALDPTSDQQAVEGSVFSYTVGASDPDVGQNLTFAVTVTNAPSWLTTTSDAASVTISGTPGETEGGATYTITVEVSDGNGGTDSEIFDLSVTETNQNPILSPITTPITINEGETAFFDAEATDDDRPEQILTFTLGVGAPAGASFDSSTGVFSWITIVADGPGTYTFDVTVSDGVGGSASQLVSIAVKGNTKIEIDTIGSEYENNFINIRARLIDNDTLTIGYSGQPLTFTTSSGTQSITTGKINITSPLSSTPFVLQHCNTVAFDESPSPLADCARDDSQPAGDDKNEVLRAVPDTIFEFEEENSLANSLASLVVTGVGKAEFVLEFTSTTDEVVLKTFNVEAGGYVSASHGFSGSAVAKVRFVSINQLEGSVNPLPNTLGVSAIVTVQHQALPSVLFKEDFEGYPLSVTSLPASVSVSDGFAFSVVQMPSETLIVTVNFAGDTTLVASSASQSISLINTDLGANAPATTVGALSPIQVPVPVGDKDLDFLSDGAETSGYITLPSGGKMYLCPTGSDATPNPCGLDPNHKNMLVEIDYCTGRAPNANVQSRLVSAFAAAKVQNPDKTPGIKLTMWADEQLTCPAVTHIFTDTDTTPLNSLEEIRQKYVGTPAVHGALLLKDNTKAQYWASTHFYLVVGVTAGTGTTINCAQAPYGIAVAGGAARTAFIGLGCSPHGNSDPLFSGTKFGNDWQYIGTAWHELWHLLGNHHTGTLETQNAFALGITNAALTKTSASTSGTTLLSLPALNTPQINGGNTITTTGPYQGFQRVDIEVKLTVAATITVGTVTQVATPNALLNMQLPYVTVTSGAGLSTQTLSWYRPVNTASAVSGLIPGTHKVVLTISGSAITGTPTVKSVQMTNLVPSAIYTQNCVPQHISGMSYSLTYPDNIDKATYFLADGKTFNTAYTPVNWSPRISDGWITTLINENSAAESQGVKGSGSQQKGVYAYGDATNRFSSTFNTWISAPIWVDWDGDAIVDTAAVAVDANNFGRPGCSATPGQTLRPNFPESTNADFYPSVSGGLVILRADHGDSTVASSSVLYTSSGFFDPIKPDGSSTFSIGNTIPVKLKVYNNGQAVPDLTTLQFRAVWLNPDSACINNCALDVTPTSKKSGGNLFRSENQGEQYVYNWNTNGRLAGHYLIFAVLNNQVIASGELVLQ